MFKIAAMLDWRRILMMFMKTMREDRGGGARDDITASCDFRISKFSFVALSLSVLFQTCSSVLISLFFLVFFLLIGFLVLPLPSFPDLFEPILFFVFGSFLYQPTPSLELSFLFVTSSSFPLCIRNRDACLD